MKRRTSNIYFILNILIVFLSALLIIFISYIKESKESEYFNEKISNLDISYHSSIDKYRILTKYVVGEEIETKLVLSLLERGIKSKDDVKRLYKGLIFRQLEPIYNKLKKDGIIQLHIHLKNNRSYIRFHKPNKYGDDLSQIRPSIVLANKENRAVTSFETGRVMSAFRNVFPLNFNNEHLGSVEISMATKTVIDSMLKLDKNREYLFLLKESLVLSKVFESQKYLYKKAIVNSDYLIETSKTLLTDSPNELSLTAININKKISNNKKLKEAIKNGKKYGMFVVINNITYDVTLIPMLGVLDNIEGYLIEYKKSENIPSIVKMEMYAYLLVLMSSILLLILIRIIEKKSKNLDNQKDWFKSITDSLGEGLYVMDMDAKITYINPVACKILGYKASEVIGKNAHTLFHSHSSNHNLKQKNCPIFLGVMNSNLFHSNKEFFCTSSGKKIPVSIRSRVINKNDGLKEIVTSFSDISNQRELEDKSALLITALESSINCVVITDKKANIQWANKAFEKLTGYKVSDIIGKNPKEFISSHKQSKEFYSEMWERLMAKKAWKGELINKKKDGTLYNEELIITPVINERNEIQNFIAIKQDITEYKISLKEKEETEKLFYQQSKMAAMGEMLGNIAHQWRQPLSVISTVSTGIKLQKEMDILNDNDLIESMNKINSSSQYLSQTIDDFRGFFEPKNSKENEFLISDLINKTLNLISSQFTDKDIEIIKNIEDCSIVSLENEFVQVLVNILNNSRDVLIEIKEERKLIFIDIFKENDNLIIEIKDNGKGIKDDIIDRVFEPYFTTKHQSQGTGIGLYMSGKIVKSHLNGTIKVENETYEFEGKEYKGAKFTIEVSVS